LCQNPTKSICDPFVFNTVITRAQSLVVCVGNPYFLCHLEETMKSGKRCWATYIKYCLECETFSCWDKNFSQSIKEKLQNTLHINQTRLVVHQIDSGDKIVEGYLDSLAKFEEHKKALRFSKKLGDIQWEEDDQEMDSFPGCYTEEDDDKSDLFTEEHIKCAIYFQSHYSAVARPLKNPNRVIHINGQGNLHGAFHESKVLVETFDNLNQSKEKKTLMPKQYGKVVKLLHPLEKPIFLCEVDSLNSNRFYPINRKDPMFYNLPFLSKTVNGVALFDINALATGEVPRIIHVIPPEIARKKIFIIHYLCWNSANHKFPVGVAIDSISKGFTFSAGERLLRIQYSFDYTEPSKAFKPIKHTEKHKPEGIFAISQKSGEVIENAFSIYASNKGNTDIYYISFYVINVAKSIEDEELIESIEKRGVSAYVKTDKLHQWKLYSMLPSKALSELRFTLNEPRHCFSVSCKVEVCNGSLDYKPVDNPIKEVVGVLTRSYTQYEVENLIENQSDISILFQVAQCLQYKRLGYYEAAYHCNHLIDASETPCTQLILKEFSLWANRLVAIELAQSLVSFPLYCKLPSSKESKQLIYKEHGMALQTSVHNKYFLPKNGFKQLPNVIINDQALSLLLESLKNNEVFKYLALLAYDNCFPQLCVATHQFRNIKRVKEFVAYTQDDDDDDDIDFNNVSHEATEYTTMFASPLTNYFDIVVQSMLSSALNFKQPKYDLLELQMICEKANRDLKRKLEFEDDVFNLQLGVTLKAFNHRIVGYVEKINDKNQLKLSFPSYELENLSEHQSSFNIAHLFAVKGSGSLDRLARVSTSVYEWKVKVASFVGPPSIFTSSNVLTLSSNDRLQDINTTVDITLFLADSSDEDKESQFFVELEKKQLKGKLKSSTVAVSQKEWNQLTSVMQNPSGAYNDAIKILSQHKKVPMQKEDFKLEAEQTVFWSGTVKIKMHSKYDMLHVWFGAAQDTTLIYPKIQQVEIVPFLKVCVKHNAEPEKCFTDVALTNASRDYYIDIDEYMELWGQVVIAENAVSSVNTRDVLLLENVYLLWPELEYCGDSYIGDYYKIPKNKYVTMSPPLDFNRSSIELFNLSKGDLLCVQYEVTDKKRNLQMGFIFHMIVHKVDISSESESEESNNTESELSTVDDDENMSTESYKISEIKYYLKCAEGAAKVSEAFRNVLKTHDPSCLVQILHIQPPQRLYVSYVKPGVLYFIYMWP